MKHSDLALLPYPQKIDFLPGSLTLGPVSCKIQESPSETQQLAAESLRSYLPKTGEPIEIRLGSVEEGYGHDWLSNEQQAFLTASVTSDEASVLMIMPGNREA